MDTLKRTLTKRDRITVTGFAIFSVSPRQTRSGRNPKRESRSRFLHRRQLNQSRRVH
ncbi:MAG: HU family DNA-binding protein [Deltaproteobacteria bacterium]|nr:MAG: HU family DNA-binding protein [Deltaproteobacteria bacterium]